MGSRQPKPLMPANEKWLYDHSPEAWSWYLVWKHAPNTGAQQHARECTPELVREDIRKAYKVFK